MAFDVLFLELEALDHLLEWFEDLLLPLDFLDLPSSIHSYPILILFVHMTVLMPMLLIGLLLSRAATTSAKLTAGLLGHIRPVSTILMVAAATAPRRSAASLALAVRLGRFRCAEVTSS